MIMCYVVGTTEDKQSLTASADLISDMQQTGKLLTLAAWAEGYCSRLCLSVCLSVSILLFKL